MNYIKDSVLTKELLLIQGTGIISGRLQKMIYDICIRVNSKFTYYNDEDLKYDIISSSFLYTYERLYKFDYEKSNGKSLPYITELIKRSQAFYFNKHQNKYMTGFLPKNSIEYVTDLYV